GSGATIAAEELPGDGAAAGDPAGAARPADQPARPDRGPPARDLRCGLGAWASPRIAPTGMQTSPVRRAALPRTPSVQREGDRPLHRLPGRGGDEAEPVDPNRAEEAGPLDRTTDVSYPPSA